MNILLKRIYEPFSESDGYRILVDRLWPRGIKKTDAKVDTWLKEVGPSTDLRKWFDHQPEKWKEFVKRYHAELKHSPGFETLVSLAKAHKTTTLVYASKEERFNQAVVLKDLLTGR